MIIKLHCRSRRNQTYHALFQIHFLKPNMAEVIEREIRQYNR